MKSNRPKVVPSILHHLHTLPDNTETTLSDIMVTLFGTMTYENGIYRFGEVEIGDMEFCDLHRQVRYEARKEGIILDDDAQAGAAVGMPFHCPFAIRRTKNLNKAWKAGKQK